MLTESRGIKSIVHKIKLPAMTLAVSIVILGCANTTNTVGAAYDADSIYCRKFARDTTIIIKKGIEGQEPLTSAELYQSYCEPLASLVDRSPSKYDKGIRGRSELNEYSLRPLYL